MKGIVIFATLVAAAFGLINVEFEDRSCWPIDAFPELVSWEGKDPILDGLPEFRKDAIQKCAKVAHKNEFRFFAVLIDGTCRTGPLVDFEFIARWPCTRERLHLYQVNTIVDVKYLPVGCRNIPHVAEDWIDLGDLFDKYTISKVWASRQEGLDKCARAAALAGYPIFGFMEGTICKAWKKPIEEVLKYEIWSNCSTPGEIPDLSTPGLIPELFHLTNVTNITLVNLGCWKRDEMDPILPRLESKSPLLGVSDYRKRVDAVRRCAIYNAARSHEIFGLTDGGACVGTPELRPPFDKSGISEECSVDGRGAENAHQVYKLLTDIRNFNFTSVELMKPLRVSSLGCWKLEWGSLIPTLEGAEEYLIDDPEWREDWIQKCAMAAWKRGWDVFAIREGRCYSAKNARKLYRTYGPSETCDLEWGGIKTLSVWETNTIRDPWFTGEGCFERCEPVEPLEKLHPLLQDDPSLRLEPIKKCAYVASLWEFDSFALMNGGRCFGLWWKETKKCVRSASCRDDGLGGRQALQIYKIKAVNNFTVENLGCWRDDAFHTIPLAEGASLELTGRYDEREDALEACARYARSRGFKLFALQAGGKCMTSEHAEDWYWRFGWSEDCRKDGRGGRWSNQVWRISEYWWEYPVEWRKVPKEWQPFGKWQCTWQWWKTPVAPMEW